MILLDDAIWPIIETLTGFSVQISPEIYNARPATSSPERRPTGKESIAAEGGHEKL